MKLLLMKPGRGDVLLAEGDPELEQDERRPAGMVRRDLERLSAWRAA